ncbi:hypothetical protein EUGRSUZ_C01860 [Eucalyptus grandis]|uniref:Uncharacterized protein n=2 Tax=Eucalyptus grandis TaxID=71139 RepID=A0A059CQ74_EUCGR|nr:hypothetical protein EUGRSUZ_C01860 [Eucalyptus grandis]
MMAPTSTILSIISSTLIGQAIHQNHSLATTSGSDYHHPTGEILLPNRVSYWPKQREKLSIRPMENARVSSSEGGKAFVPAGSH